MFALQESLGSVQKLHFNNKRLPMGSKSERLVSQFRELSCNPKGNLAYKIFFDMQEENNFVSEIAISYSPTRTKNQKLTTAHLTARILRKMWDKNLISIQEQFCVLFLNNNMQVIGFRCLHTGTITSASIDFRILFGIACKSLSTNLIIAHNHPSGSLIPSTGDIEVTLKIKKACDLMQIRLVDHIILTQKGHMSLSNLGII